VRKTRGLIERLSSLLLLITRLPLDNSGHIFDHLASQSHKGRMEQFWREQAAEKSMKDHFIVTEVELAEVRQSIPLPKKE